MTEASMEVGLPANWLLSRVC